MLKVEILARTKTVKKYRVLRLRHLISCHVQMHALCHMSSVLVVASFASAEELYSSAKGLLRVASQRERMESPQGMTCELFMTASMHYLNINILQRIYINFRLAPN